MMKLFHLTTKYVQKIKNLIDSLKEIMIETNIEFSSQFVKISKLNSINSICCLVTLSHEELNRNGNTYECAYPETKPLVIGINLLHLSKILKTISSDNILEFEVNETNKNVLQIKVETDARLEVSTYSMNLIEVNEEQMAIPDVQFDAIVKIESKYLQKQIKDINTLDSKYVDLKAFNNQLIITGSGGFIRRETIVEEPDASLSKCIHNTIKMVSQMPNQICQGKYSTKDLLCLSKFTNLAKYFNLKLKNDVPLVVEIPVEFFGNVILVITLQNSV
jgi:proliferating cell nuclear antigen PCNA